MPEKFRKLLGLIKEQIFYNADRIVVLDQFAWEGAGLAKSDIQQGIKYLTEKDLVHRHKVWDVFKEKIVPVNHEDREFMLKEGVISTKYDIDGKYLKSQVALEVCKGFDDFLIGLDQSEPIKESPINKPKINFDAVASALLINDEKIQISIKSDKVNAHYVLDYIFNNPEGLSEPSDYSDIITNKFPGEEKEKWRKCYRACEDIQSKILKGTKSKIEDFLVFTSGITGSVHINSKYIQE